jgi:cell shape-determining protein MreC
MIFIIQRKDKKIKVSNKEEVVSTVSSFISNLQFLSDYFHDLSITDVAPVFRRYEDIGGGKKGKSLYNFITSENILSCDELSEAMFMGI